MSKSLSPADGLIAVVKKDCPTCEMVTPALEQIAGSGVAVAVWSQDDPTFPPGFDVGDDRDLELSYRLSVATVPTLIRVEGGREVERFEGWLRDGWESLSGVVNLAPELPPQRPGCGSRSVEPGIAERLEARFGDRLQARQVAFGDGEDPHEALFDRGWTDGLPVVPPTPERVVRMLSATSRASDEVVAEIPPNLAPATVEKIAITAVMAGCKPEYLPVVLAAVEAACRDEFALHGLLATTMPHGPVVIVGGEIARRIGMNSGINAFGQGNRANATIGRALQLVVRNVGGGRPGEVDRACFGSPAKYTFCFAENEADSPWESLSVERGFDAGVSTVTLFGGEAPRVVVDQLSRDPESLARSFALCLRTVCHPKLPLVFDAILAVSPEHGRVFREAGWSKARLRQEILGQLMLPWEQLERGADGMAEGVPESMRAPVLPKFQPEGLLIVHVGGPAGLFSAIIGGWVNNDMGTRPVTVEVRP